MHLACSTFKLALALVLGLILHGIASSQPPANKTTPSGLSLEVPSPQVLFRVQSEADWQRELRETAGKVLFPPDAQPTPKAANFAETTPVSILTVPSGRICFHSLYFQDVRTERHMKSWGIVEPLRSALLFYAKGVALPATMLAVPPFRFQCWDYPVFQSIEHER